MMSSEDEEVNDENEKVFIVRSPPWRPSQISEFLHLLDKVHNENSSDRSKFRTFKRKAGAPSTRPEPKWTDAQKKVMKALLNCFII